MEGVDSGSGFTGMITQYIDIENLREVEIISQESKQNMETFSPFSFMVS